MIDFYSQAYFDQYGGVWRWISNDRIPFDDMLINNGVTGACLERCRELREIQQERLITEYKRSQEEAMNSPEAATERNAELRAAFGPGVVVVDAITGRRTRT